MEARTDWSQLVEDYDAALVRLALARIEKKFYLLMGYVELYPRDIPCPDTFYESVSGWKVPDFKGAVLHVGATKMKVADALAWYEAAAAGTVTLPEVRKGEPMPVVAPSLGAEPTLGDFVLDDTVPFAAQWHGGPRVHRLVPMSRLDEAVRGLETKAEAREWLAANFGFDPLGDEEWRGSLSILAPDPLLEGVRHFIQETQGDGTERIVFYAKRRRFPDYPAADAGALQLVTYERRPSGWTHAGPMPLDSLGFLVEDHKQAVAESGYTITCPKRGLLRLVPPRSWLRVASLGIQAVEQLLTVQVAAGGRRKPSDVYQVERVTDLGPTATGQSHTSAASLRIGQLRATRAAHLLEESMPQRLFGITGAKDDATEEELRAARERALEYVVSLVEPAMREVYFVDVDWSYRETTLYAHRVARSGVKVRILTSSRIFAEKKPADAGDPKPDIGSAPKGNTQVATARQTLEYLDDIHARVHGADIEVRVMPGSSKPAFHDRFLIVDDDVWCCGPSFNELGERIGVISRSHLPRPILRVIREVWDRSNSMSAFDPDFEKRKRKSGEEPQAEGGAGESK